MNKNIIKLPVTIGPIVKGVLTVSTGIQLKYLSAIAEVDWRDEITKTGYQRKPSPNRVNKLAKELESNRVAIPTSLLVNIRDVPENKYLKYGKDLSCEGKTPDDINAHSKNGNIFWLELNLELENTKAYIIDGQHRYLAYQKLFEKDNSSLIGNTIINVVFMLGASFESELEQFYTVNSTAKSVSTALAYSLIRDQADNNMEFRDLIYDAGQGWKIEGQELLDELVKNSLVWKGLITLPNADKGNSVIPSTSLIKSLKPILSSSYIERLSLKNKIKLIDAYWLAIKKIFPEAFDISPRKDKSDLRAKDFAILKGFGVNVINQILPATIEILRDKNKPLEKDSFYPVLKEVFTSIEDVNNKNEQVNGKEFWLVASKGGAAGAYSSEAGMKQLTRKIKTLLPNLEIN